jgi:DNA-binding protein Fis
MSVRGVLAERLLVDRLPEASRLKVSKPEERSLRECAESAVRRYFTDLGETDPREFYDLVLAEMEVPLMLVVLERNRG